MHRGVGVDTNMLFFTLPGIIGTVSSRISYNLLALLVHVMVPERVKDFALPN
jgi:hypothetical protein